MRPDARFHRQLGRALSRVSHRHAWHGQVPRSLVETMRSQFHIGTAAEAERLILQALRATAPGQDEGAW